MYEHERAQIFLYKRNCKKITTMLYTECTMYNVHCTALPLFFYDVHIPTATEIGRQSKVSFFILDLLFVTIKSINGIPKGCMEGNQRYCMVYRGPGFLV